MLFLPLFILSCHFVAAEPETQWHQDVKALNLIKVNNFEKCTELRNHAGTLVSTAVKVRHPTILTEEDIDLLLKFVKSLQMEPVP